MSVVPLDPQQREGLSAARSLDPELQQLKTKYLTESNDNNEFENDLYVATQGMPHPGASENEYLDLAQHVHEFLVRSFAAQSRFDWAFYLGAGMDCNEHQ